MAKPASKSDYRRVIVKVSGEALSGPEGFGIHQPTIDRIATDLRRLRRLGGAVAGIVQVHGQLGGACVCLIADSAC